VGERPRGGYGALKPGGLGPETCQVFEWFLAGLKRIVAGLPHSLATDAKQPGTECPAGRHGLPFATAAHAWHEGDTTQSRALPTPFFQEFLLKILTARERARLWLFVLE